MSNQSSLRHKTDLKPRWNKIFGSWRQLWFEMSARVLFLVSKVQCSKEMKLMCSSCVCDSL